MNNTINQNSIEDFVNCLSAAINEYHIIFCEHLDKGYLTHADCLYLEMIKREYSRVKAKKRGKIFLSGGF